MVLAACTRSPVPKLARADSAPVQDSADSGRAHLTDHYVRLLRAQLTADDPHQTQVAIGCEALRVLRVVTDTSRDKLAGENQATRLLNMAARQAYVPADLPARKRVDSVLAGQMFGVDEQCDSLARAGILGDTAWPKFKKWKE